MSENGDKYADFGKFTTFISIDVDIFHVFSV